MSLDALINLQAKYNDQGRQGIQQLAKNIGGILQQKGIQDFERNAMDILRDGATPEKMEQISSMYPNMPKQEIWKFASEAGKRVDAQKLKDVFKNFQGWTQSLKQAGKAPTAKDVQAWMESQNLSQAQQGVVMQNFSKMVEFAKVGQPKRSMFNIGGQGAVQLENGVPVGETIGAPGPDVEMRTIYGPNNKTRRVPITKGKIYAPPEGWSENKPSEGDTKGTSAVDAKRLFDMMASYEKNPTPAKLLILNDLAKRQGYEMGEDVKEPGGWAKFKDWVSGLFSKEEGTGKRNAGETIDEYLKRNS